MKTVSGKAIEEFLKSDPRKEVAFNEGDMVNWFEKSYKQLGFDKIIKHINSDELRSLVSSWEEKKGEKK